MKIPKWFFPLRRFQGRGFGPDDSREMSLPKGRLMKIPHAEPGLQIMCVSGMIWLTGENDRADHLMGERACCRIESSGLVLAEALEDSVVQVACTCLQPSENRYRRSFRSFVILLRTSRS